MVYLLQFIYLMHSIISIRFVLFLCFQKVGVDFTPRCETHRTELPEMPWRDRLHSMWVAVSHDPRSQRADPIFDNGRKNERPEIRITTKTSQCWKLPHRKWSRLTWYVSVYVICIVYILSVYSVAICSGLHRFLKHQQHGPICDSVSFVVLGANPHIFRINFL